jgi:hypothetical protein
VASSNIVLLKLLGNCVEIDAQSFQPSERRRRVIETILTVSPGTWP